MKIVATEFVAYLQLAGILETAGTLSPRGAVIATYALLGFANIPSIAIQIGGIGGIAPQRRGDLSRLGFKAMVGGNLADETRVLTTAVLLDVQRGEFASAIALSLILLVLIFLVNAILTGVQQRGRSA